MKVNPNFPRQNLAYSGPCCHVTLQHFIALRVQDLIMLKGFQIELDFFSMGPSQCERAFCLKYQNYGHRIHQLGSLAHLAPFRIILLSYQAGGFHGFTARISNRFTVLILILSYNQQADKSIPDKSLYLHVVGVNGLPMDPKELVCCLTLSLWSSSQLMSIGPTQLLTG